MTKKLNITMEKVHGGYVMAVETDFDCHERSIFVDGGVMLAYARKVMLCVKDKNEEFT